MLPPKFATVFEYVSIHTGKIVETELPETNIVKINEIYFEHKADVFHFCTC